MNTVCFCAAGLVHVVFSAKHNSGYNRHAITLHVLVFHKYKIA